jgi:hypothetical protein
MHADETYAYEMHADEMHADEMHADETLADEMHTDEMLRDWRRKYLLLGVFPSPSSISTYSSSPSELEEYIGS